MLTQKMTRVLGITRNIALYAGIVFLIFWAIRGNCHTLEIEFRGPEIIEQENRARERENERAAERVERGSTNERDLERAFEHKMDTLV